MILNLVYQNAPKRCSGAFVLLHIVFPLKTVWHTNGLSGTVSYLFYFHRENNRAMGHMYLYVFLYMYITVASAKMHSYMSVDYVERFYIVRVMLFDRCTCLRAERHNDITNYCTHMTRHKDCLSNFLTTLYICYCYKEV